MIALPSVSPLAAWEPPHMRAKPKAQKESAAMAKSKKLLVI